MAGPLATIITQVAACTTLRDSAAALLEGLAGVLDTSAPAVATAIRANEEALIGALTVNTSHIAVDLSDPGIPHAQRFFALKRANRATQIAALQALLDQLTAQDGP